MPPTLDNYRSVSASSTDALELSIEQPVFLVDQLSQTILVCLTVVLNLVACRLPVSGRASLEPIDFLWPIGRDVMQGLPLIMGGVAIVPVAYRRATLVRRQCLLGKSECS
jgi:hypothetical protein